MWKRKIVWGWYFIVISMFRSSESSKSRRLMPVQTIWLISVRSKNVAFTGCSLLQQCASDVLVMTGTCLADRMSYFQYSCPSFISLIIFSRANCSLSIIWQKLQLMYSAFYEIFPFVFLCHLLISFLAIVVECVFLYACKPMCYTLKILFSRLFLKLKSSLKSSLRCYFDKSNVCDC